MPYRLKSTPFFQRLVITSKRNGQLQKLKEEYDRIKDFNEHAIEMKMRQVRLKRLFREIEEIKESSTHFKRRRINSDKHKSSEELRLESFRKAKELGKEYSRMNAVADPFIPRGGSKYTIGRTKVNAQAERKASAIKRINYGNKMSRSNTKKLAPSKSKKQVPPPEQAPTEEYLMQKEKLKQRLSYGNSCSKKNKRSKKRSNRVDQIVAASTTQLRVNSPMMEGDKPEIAQHSLTNVLVAAGDLKSCKSSTSVQTVKNNPASEEMRALKRERARRNWRKVAFFVSNCFASYAPELINDPSPQQSESAFEFDEFKLRNISNDTHLPISQINVQSKLPLSEGNDDILSGEVLIGMENLNFDSQSETINVLEPRQPTPPPIAAVTVNELTPTAKSSPTEVQVPPIAHKVQNYVKLFEPIVREAAEKEVFEYGVHKLCNIFEHQNSE